MSEDDAATTIMTPKDWKSGNVPAVAVFGEKLGVCG